MMISVTSRRTFGFTDNFEGYVFLKDGTYPIAQLHFYRDYNTFFWLGHATFNQLSESLGNTISDISRRQHESFYDLNKGIAQYGSEAGFKYAEFEIRSNWSDQMDLHLMHQDQSIELTDQHTREMSFVRFDITSTLGLPIILWADLTKADNSEIGFSTTVELPESVLLLFQNTCRFEISDSELDDIRGHITDNVDEPVLV